MGRYEKKDYITVKAGCACRDIELVVVKQYQGIVVYTMYTVFPTFHSKLWPYEAHSRLSVSTMKLNAYTFTRILNASLLDTFPHTQYTWSSTHTYM